MNSREEALSLFQKNRALAPWTLNKYYTQLSQDEDLLQEAYIGLWKSCLTYDSSKGIKFATYASRCICNQIGMELRKRNSRTSLVILSMDAPLSNGEEEGSAIFADLIEDEKLLMENQGIYLRDFISHLNKRDSNLVQTQLSGLNQKEASQLLGVSRPYCSQLLKRIREEYESYSNEDISKGEL